MTSRIVDEWFDRFGSVERPLPSDVIETARLCLVDWVGCAVAGSTDPVARISRRRLEQYRDGGSGVFGEQRRVPAAAAAFANGVAGHALDFDDTHPAMPGHPTSVVAPAALATAEELDSSIGELVAAIAIGNEVAIRAGTLLGRRHYESGWHTTSTAGIFGAVAATAALRRLERTAFMNAVGLAASRAAGLRANFGTMGKPGHAGNAASDAVQCVDLALGGATATPLALEGNRGLVVATTGQLGQSNAATADGWTITQIEFKLHASCFGTHPTIEAVKQLRSNGLDPDRIDALTVDVPEILRTVCGIDNPRTGLEAKFSLGHVAAMAALGLDTGDPNAFSDAAVVEDRLADMRSRVVVNYVYELPDQHVRIQVTLDTGTSFDTDGCRASNPAGADERRSQLRRKFVGLTAPFGVDAARAWSLVMDGDLQPASSLIDVASSTSRPE